MLNNKIKLRDSPCTKKPFNIIFSMWELIERVHAYDI